MYMNKITIMIIALFSILTIGCGEAARFVDCIDGCSNPVGPMGPQGEAGVDGTDGQNGDSVSIEKVSIEMEASRLYGPSLYFPSTTLSKAGLYKFPEELDLVYGAAGTGWASITLEDARLCYQGNGGNNNTVGTKFVFKRVVSPNSECYNGAVIANSLEPILMMSDEEIVLSFHGGGISLSLRDGTHVVKASIKANVIKNN